MIKRKPYINLSKRQQKRRLAASLQQDLMTVNKYENRRNKELKKTVPPDNTKNNDIPTSDNDFDPLVIDRPAGISVSINESRINEPFIEFDHFEVPEILLHDNSAGCDKMKEFLSSWACLFNIKNDALTCLLKGLKESGYNNLPGDARTLLQTPRKGNVVLLANGTYAHYGLEKALIDQFKRVDNNQIPSQLFLYINVDGLPLSKSSQSDLWPILGKIVHSIFENPFLIGAYHGKGKPSSANQFLEPFIHEYLRLSTEGFLYHNCKYIVTIKAFLADTPARNFITCFPAHNSRCGRCIQEGQTINRRRVFLDRNSPLRTDDNFRLGVPKAYENVISPLEGIGISMSKQVPHDPMHLISLGVLKKHGLIFINQHGNGVDAQARIRNLSREYCSFNKWIPIEFPRGTRGFDEFSRFKATELRMLLLYTGPVIFRKYVTKDQIIHFNSLNCAARLLSDPEECIRNNNFARDLLHYYVHTMERLYGPENIVYNIHNLIHVPDDVLSFGPLDDFSCYVFENHLQYLKKLVRKGSFVLAQIINRIHEEAQVISPKAHNQFKDVDYILKNKINNSDRQLPAGCSNAYKTIEFENFVLTQAKPNNCCYLTDNSIVVIQFICHSTDSEGPVIVGHRYVDPTAIEDYPIDSKLMNICKVKLLSESLEKWCVTEIYKKAFRILSGEYFYVFPLLHTKN